MNSIAAGNYYEIGTDILNSSVRFLWFYALRIPNTFAGTLNVLDFKL